LEKKKVQYDDDMPADRTRCQCSSTTRQRLVTVMRWKSQ
jgi:hypothetical protein